MNNMNMNMHMNMFRLETWSFDMQTRVAPTFRL